MKATNLILSTVITLTAVTSLAEKTDRSELTPKEARNYVHLPYGTPTEKKWKYDGWIIRGDIFFYNRIVKHEKIIEKGAPEMYAVGQKYVYLIRRNPDNSDAFVGPNGGIVGIGERELNPSHWAGMVTAALMHEFQHCDPRPLNIEGGEGAAEWTAVQYGKQTGVAPEVTRWWRLLAPRRGDSQAKWDAKGGNLIHLRK